MVAAIPDPKPGVKCPQCMWVDSLLPIPRTSAWVCGSCGATFHNIACATGDDLWCQCGLIPEVGS